MKKIITWLVIAVIFFFAQTLNASEETHKKTAEEFLFVIGVKDIQTRNYEQLKQAFMLQMNPMFMSMTDSTMAQAMIEKVIDRLNKELSWENLESEYVKLYMEVFTEAEMKEIINFFKSPSGQKLTNKTPEILERSVQVEEKKVTNIMPEIADMIRETGSGKQEQKEITKDQTQMQMRKH